MLEKIKENRSCRAFEKTFISEAEIKTILMAARYSASARNAQVLRYLYTNQEQDCRVIFPYTHWAGAISWNPTEEEGPSAYILVCTDTEKPGPSHYIDMGLALQNMSLVARDLGYATCILGAYQKKEVETLLGLPSKYHSFLLLAIGKPKDVIEVIDAENTKIPYAREKNNHHKVYKLSLEQLLLTSTHEKN